VEEKRLDVSISDMPYDVEEAYIEIRTMLVCIYIK
jgi:hypothetical protein